MVTFVRLDRREDALAPIEELVARFVDAPELELRERAATALMMKNFRFVQVSPACVILPSIVTLWRAFWRASSSLRLCAT